MLKLRATLTACLLLLLTICPCVSGQSKPAPGLDEQIKTEVASFKGKVFIFAKNLDTGETYALDADERVRTASTIKIAVMIEAFRFNFIENTFDGGIGKLFSPNYPKSLAVHDLNPLARLQ